ncbi:MAG: beta-lactamase family protein [Acidobacteria bacterium]|nr:beta-lactamase family protein [Acidobacteriota bacterium]
MVLRNIVNTMRNLACLFAAVVLAASATLTQQSPAARYQTPPARDDAWQTANADSLGVDSVRLAALTQSIRSWPELGVHAILIERNGRLIYEEYFDGFDERWGQPLGRVTMTADSKHDLRSITKSVVSALVGIAHGEGKIQSLDQPLTRWFPEYADLDTLERRRVTLRHALSMTSGFDWNEDVSYNDPRNDEIRMTRDSQPLRYALARPFVVEPGSDFKYNGGLTQVLAAVLERASKMSLEDYARTKLFEPLGITDVEWVGSLAGMPAAASGLRMRARDLAKFGSLYLNGGKWKGKQVIPADWVDLSTRRHFKFRSQPGPNSSGQFGYGFFWWYSCYPSTAGLVEARTAVGNGQQRIFVLPTLNTVVTIFGGRYNDFTTGNTLGRRILLDHVIPAVKTGVQTGCPGA